MRGSGRSPLPDFPFLDHDGPIAFAHRGGAGGGLENSMAAFQQAVDLGYRYVETDVQATADGVLLAFHDRTLDRVTGLTGGIGDQPYARVRDARIAGVHPIPTLEEVLGTWPLLRVNIDVKSLAATGPLAQVIRRTGSIDRVCVASFSQRRVSALRRALGPRLCTALAPSRVVLLRVASMSRLAAALAPRGVPCVQVPDRLGPLPVVTGPLVSVAHRHGLRVHVWTIDDARDMNRLLDLGVDGIMTDQIGTLKDVLRARGAWPSPV
jgi:glycerophosphoryl diester phosphodiesterase